MATIGEMVSTLAHAIAMPEESVAQVSRILRDAGMIKSGGRGRSAAKMSAEDCANLLIAMMISDQAKNAPKYVALSHKLKRTRYNGEFVIAGFNFQSALSHLLKFVANEQIESYREGDLFIEVSVDRPMIHGHINLRTGRFEKTQKTLFSAGYFMDVEDIVGSRSDDELMRLNPPLKIDATVNEIVVLSLADLLKA